MSTRECETWRRFDKLINTGRILFMKKRILALGLAVCTVLSFVGCGKDENPTETTTAAATVNVVLEEEGKLTLPNYKGLVVYSDDVKVSEEDLQKYLNTRLEAFATTEYVKEGTLEKNMEIKISYTGTIDGKEFTGSSSPAAVAALTDKGFVINGSAVPGFADAVIGKNVGDTVEMDLTLPKDYSVKDLQNKTAHFVVKIDSIVKVVEPKLSNEYVEKEYGELGIKTVEEFMDYLRETLYMNNVYAKVWPTIIENTTVQSYAKADYEEMFKSVSESEEQIIYMNYGYTLDQYLALLGMTQSDWDFQISEYVKGTLKEEMIIEELAKVEKLEPTEEEFNRKMLEYAKSYGMSTVDELKEYYGAEDEAYWFSVRTYKVQKFVVDNATVKEGSDPNKATTAAK